jgi:hypothetical protein
MCNATIILQDVVILCSSCFDKPLYNWLFLSQHSLCAIDSCWCIPESRSAGHPGCQSISLRGTSEQRALFQLADIRIVGRAGGGLTACPLLKGLISRKARTFSDSKSLKEGISPEVCDFSGQSRSAERLKHL